MHSACQNTYRNSQPNRDAPEDHLLRRTHKERVNKLLNVLWGYAGIYGIALYLHGDVREYTVLPFMYTFHEGLRGGFCRLRSEFHNLARSGNASFRRCSEQSAFPLLAKFETHLARTNKTTPKSRMESIV